MLESKSKEEVSIKFPGLYRDDDNILTYDEPFYNLVGRKGFTVEVKQYRPGVWDFRAESNEGNSISGDSRSYLYAEGLMRQFMSTYPDLNTKDFPPLGAYVETEEEKNREAEYQKGRREIWTFMQFCWLAIGKSLVRKQEKL